ncbi:MAG: type IX secretion system sortase PorU [Paludibacter sp.]|nr:type IX secretion system sortase PorU [Paludibacter sp.]
MKHLHILSIALFIFGAVHGQTPTAYADNSALANGKFVKIKIKDSGIYKLTYNDLRNMGIAPENVRIFGYGGGVIDQNFANPSPDDLPEIAVWQGNDYILFYAQGIVKWSYNTANKMFQHNGNPYATEGYYFVTSDAGVGKKITVAQAEQPNSNVQEINEFTDFQVYEKDEVSLIQSGREFYGEKFDTQTSYNFTFNFPNAVTTAPTKLCIAYATSSNVSNSMMITSLGSFADTTKTNASTTDIKFVEMSKYITVPTSMANSVVKMTYLKQSTWTAYLNFIEINTNRLLKMTGTQMRFQKFDSSTADFYKYNLSDANNNVIVWDISDFANIKQMSTQRSEQTLSFVTPAENRYFLAIDPTANFPKPETVGTITNQNLHNLRDIDFTIITHPAFWEEANTLAQAHRDIDGMNVVVVTTEQVYNEFSSGTPDISAYRKLMRMQYERDSVNHKPKYLLLFGRGSYDNRGLLRETAGNNLILTFQAKNSGSVTSSYVTDDYVGMMVDSANDEKLVSNKIAVATGRFPVITKDDAQAVVNKTIEYMKNKQRSIWKNQILYMADDGNNAGDYDIYMKANERISSMVFEKHPEYQINKIYIDAFKQVSSASGDTYPDAKAKLLGLFNSGVFFFNYLGHAGSSGLTGEQVLVTDDIKRLTNKNLFLCFAGTCDFIHFDLPRVSAGEYLLTNPVGGSIGILSASRTVFADGNDSLSTAFNKILFDKMEDGSHNTVGEILILAKNAIGGSETKLSYVYLGDPAVILNYPDKYHIITTQINDNTELAGNDTIKALSINTIKGEIVDENGMKVEYFTGNVFINIYDKIQTIKTLNNDPYSAGKTFTFPDRPNKIFSGKTSVTDGEFEFTFMVPKDIQYNFGTGRINYYAEMDSDNEAQGYFEDFVIGGSSDVLITDTEGPVIENMYLNSPNFKDGSKVNETPYFVVRVSDEYGINTIGNGIGHDATLILNNDPQEIFILNDYFIADFGTYQSGTFEYLLPELKDGKYSLSFKVWDLLNNSSQAQLNFEVQKGLKPDIFDLYNYPNPAGDYTIFEIVTDRPQDVLQAKIEIFDMMGRKIWEFSQKTTDKIRWDINSSNGTYLSSGIYIYRLTLSTLNSGTSYKSNKLIIKKQ